MGWIWPQLWTEHSAPTFKVKTHSTLFLDSLVSSPLKSADPWVFTFIAHLSNRKGSLWGNGWIKNEWMNEWAASLLVPAHSGFFRWVSHLAWFLGNVMVPLIKSTSSFMDYFKSFLLCPGPPLTFSNLPPHLCQRSFWNANLILSLLCFKSKLLLPVVRIKSKLLNSTRHGITWTLATLWFAIPPFSQVLSFSPTTLLAIAPVCFSLPQIFVWVVLNSCLPRDS